MCMQYIKYYEGLGSSPSAEAKEYFSDLNTHQIDFSWYVYETTACSVWYETAKVMV